MSKVIRSLICVFLLTSLAHEILKLDYPKTLVVLFVTLIFEGLASSFAKKRKLVMIIYGALTILTTIVASYLMYFYQKIDPFIILVISLPFLVILWHLAFTYTKVLAFITMMTIGIVASLYREFNVFYTIIYITSLIYLLCDRIACNKKVTILVLILSVVFVVSLIEPYDVLKNIDSIIYTPSGPCSRGIRHYLGLCTCKDRGIIDNDGTIRWPGDDITYEPQEVIGRYDPSLGDGSLSNLSVTNDNTILYHITSDRQFDYIKAYTAASYYGTEKSFVIEDYLVRQALDDSGLAISLSEELYGLEGSGYHVTIEKTSACKDQYILVPYGLNDIEYNYRYDSFYYDQSALDEGHYEYYFDDSVYMKSDELATYEENVVSIYLNKANIAIDLGLFLYNNMIPTEHSGDNQEVEAIVRRVIDLLKDEYTYTKTIDIIESEDPIINFLLHSKKGYCTHFAASAVLLLRQCDIPARFVSGYKISTWDQNEATIRANDAHAWIEVYYEGIGWIPYEVTSAYSSSPSIESNRDPVVETERPDDREEIEDRPVVTPSTPIQDEEVIQEVKEEVIDLSFIKIIIGILATMIALFIVCLVFIYWRNHRPYRDKIYTAYMFLSKYDFIDEDVIKIMEKRRFSNHEMTKDDYLILYRKEKELARSLTKVSLFEKLYIYLRYNFWL